MDVIAPQSDEVSTVISSEFVVVGGGIAGVSCTVQLAQQCPEVPILLVTASSIVKAATNFVKLRRVMETFDVEEKSLTYLEQLYPNVKVRQDVLLSLDTNTRVAALKSGQKVSYKFLCLCLGGRPQLLEAGNPLVLGVRDTETVEALQARLAGAKRVAVVGNGGIATELVYEIQGCEVLWAVRQNSIGTTFFDPGAAQFFLSRLHSNNPSTTEDSRSFPESRSSDPGIPGSALGPEWASGHAMVGAGEKAVHVEYNCEVQQLLTPKEFESQSLKETLWGTVRPDWPIYVLLTNGNVFGCDFVVSATGVTPNADTIQAPQLKLSTDGGIIVDQCMRTSLDGIYAAGDVCSPSWTPSELWFQMRLWTQAHQMGDWAGQCMAAQLLHQEDPILDARFDLFCHVTRFFGFRVVLMGLFNGQGLQGHRALVRISPGVEFVKVLLYGGRLKGAILVGDTELEETCENLLLDQLDLGPLADQLLDPEVDIEDYFD